MVWCVWEMLSFKTYCASSWECGPVLSFVSVSPIVGIYLHSRFCGIHFHCSAAYRFFDACSETEFAFFFFVQYKAMVISCAILYLLVVGINVLSYSFRFTEIERSVFYKSYFTCSNTRLVYWQVVRL